MSRGALIAIVAGIIIAAVAAGIVAATSGNQQQEATENGDEVQGRQLTLELSENLSLEGSP